MRYLTAILASSCLFAVATAPAIADDMREKASNAAATDKATVEQAINMEWISLTGTVQSVSADRFTLKYGDGQIDIEMDGYGWKDQGYLRNGDRVTVTGRVDNDLYEKKKIEASSVFVPRRNEYFSANPADEEDGYYASSVGQTALVGAAEDDEWVAFTGTVTSIDGDEIAVNTGYRTIDVDLGDASGPEAPVIDIGDRVSVSGEMDDADLFDAREVEATSVVIIRNRVM